MGLFDFFKKAELDEIKRLNETIKQQNEAFRQQSQTNSELTTQIQQLSIYQGLVDIDAKLVKRWEEYNDREKAYSLEQNTWEKNILIIKTQYKELKQIFDELQKQINLYKDESDLAEYGIYEPNLDSYDSEEIKEDLKDIKSEQKDLIADKEAVLGGETVTLDGSHSKGQQMVNKWKKIMLRAFNGECDSFIANTSWNNFTKMQERIKNAYKTINKIMETQDVHISDAYLQSKLIELQTSYEYKVKKQQEKEEQQAIRAQMKEEERAAKEFATAQAKAEKEESIYQKALEKARKQLEETSGTKHDAMEAQIAELEARLQEASANKQRAISMAQQTKCGHVYVISNIGSFGENVYKIGMTRRLDPLDRVKELGDASVPFTFDVHAMIYSDNAPKLEAKLHDLLEESRVNLINRRKEFFKIDLSKIEKIAKKNNASITFTKIAEAQEYRETCAIRQRASQQQITTNTTNNTFPEAI